MRKWNALIFMLCGVLLVALLAVAGRMTYLKYHKQSFEKIIGERTPSHIILLENDRTVLELTEENAIQPFADLLRGYTYTEYPKLIPPREDKLTADRLTVQFANGSTIAVNADGYVFVNDKLRDISGSRGQEFYHKLYILCFPA